MKKIALLQALEQEMSTLDELQRQSQDHSEDNIAQCLAELKHALRSTFAPLGVEEQAVTAGLILRSRSLTISLLQERLETQEYWLLRAQGVIQRNSRVQIVRPVPKQVHRMPLAESHRRLEGRHLRRYLSYHRQLIQRIRTWMNRNEPKGWHFRLVMDFRPSYYHDGTRLRTELSGQPYASAEELVKAWLD